LEGAKQLGVAVGSLLADTSFPALPGVSCRVMKVEGKVVFEIPITGDVNLWVFPPA